MNINSILGLIVTLFDSKGIIYTTALTTLLETFIHK